MSSMHLYIISQRFNWAIPELQFLPSIQCHERIFHYWQRQTNTCGNLDTCQQETISSRNSLQCNNYSIATITSVSMSRIRSVMEKYHTFSTVSLANIRSPSEKLRRICCSCIRIVFKINSTFQRYFSRIKLLPMKGT